MFKALHSQFIIELLKIPLQDQDPVVSLELSLLSVLPRRTMAQIRAWVPPNTASQPRALRYTDDVWNSHKPDLIREYCQGGLSITHQWIESQNLLDFRPTYVLFNSRQHSASGKFDSSMRL
jgi:hypothetical protein